VLVNGRRVRSVDYGAAAGPSMVRVTLPAAVVGVNREILLGWRIRDPRSPHSLGMSADPRALGLFVRRVSLLERVGPRAQA
jgi:hypothetical protein